MKVPPKRKGNGRLGGVAVFSPGAALNESPSEKEGKSAGPEEVGAGCGPSMKVPPKRKGNPPARPQAYVRVSPLNESPSEKEGKWPGATTLRHHGVYPQ